MDATRADALVRTCQFLVRLLGARDVTEAVCEGLEEVAEHAAALTRRLDALAECYPAVHRRALAGEDPGMQERLHRLRDACGWVGRLFEGPDAAAALWSECPLGERRLWEGALLCTAWSVWGQDLLQLYATKKGEGRPKRKLLRLFVEMGKRAELGYDKLAGLLLPLLDGYKSEDTLEGALKDAASGALDVELLTRLASYQEGAFTAIEQYVPAGVDPILWISAGFPAKPRPRHKG